MRVVIIADFHIHGQLFEFKMRLLRDIVASKPDLIIFAGDIAHQAKLGDGKISTFETVKSLNEVLDCESLIVAIEGNHDQFGRSGSSLDLLNTPNLLKVRDSVQVIEIGDYVFAFVPWLRDRADWKEAVLSGLSVPVDTNKPRVLVGHCNINKAQNQFGQLAVNPSDYFTFNLDDLERSAFKPDLVFLGHIHHGQRLSKRSHYIGAFTENNFGEQGISSGYVELLAGDAGGYSFFDHDISPTFLTLTHEEFVAHGEIEENEFIRVRTSQPEAFSRHPRLFLIPESKESSKHVETSYRGSGDFKRLVEEYVQANDIPMTDSLRSKLAQVSESLGRDQTGLSRVNRVVLKDIRADGFTLFEDRDVRFGPGLTAIVGPNGRGKSMLIESILAGLYGSYVERGAIKNFIHGELLVEIEDSDGVRHSVRHTPSPKGDGVSTHLNGVLCRTKTSLLQQLEPKIGTKNVFHSVCFMDQCSAKDLVTQSESKALDILQDMLDLKALDPIHKELQEEARKLKEELARVSGRIEVLQETPHPGDPPSSEYCPALESTLKEELRVLDDLEKRVEAEKRLEKTLSKELIDDELDCSDEEFERLSWASVEYETAFKRLKNNYYPRIGCHDSPIECPLRKDVHDKAKDMKTVQEKEANHIRFKEVSELRTKRASLEKQREGARRALDYFEAGERKTSMSRQEVVEALKEAEAQRKAFSEWNLKMSMYESAQKSVAEEIIKREKLLQEQSANKTLVDMTSKKGLPKFVISGVVAELQKTLDRVCDLAETDIRISVKADEEEFDVLFSCAGRPWTPVVPASSQGQRGFIKVLFRLAMCLFLNRYFGNYKVLILDEPDKSLDVNYVSAITRVLKSLKGELNQVIVVTHSDYLTHIADEVIRLE